MTIHRESNSDIERLVQLASSYFGPDSFSEPLPDPQADALVALHSMVGSRYGSRAASRAVFKLGGAPALQQLLRALHKRKIAGAAQAKLMADIDEMLQSSDEIDWARGAAS